MFQVLHLAALIIIIVIKYTGCPPTLKKIGYNSKFENYYDYIKANMHRYMYFTKLF